MPAETREPSIEDIEYTGAENEPDREMKELRRGVGIRRLEECALHDLERGGESAEKIAGRHQVRQQIDFRVRRAHLLAKPGDHADPSGNAVAHLHQDLGVQRQIYFRSRAKANHPEVLPFLQFVPNVRPAHDPARDHAG